MEYVIELFAASLVCEGVSMAFGLVEGSLAILSSLVTLPSAAAVEVDVVPKAASFPAAAGVVGCVVAAAVPEAVEAVESSGFVSAVAADVWLSVGDVAGVMSAELQPSSAVLLGVGLFVGTSLAFAAVVPVVFAALLRVSLDALSCTVAELVFFSIAPQVAVPSTLVVVPLVPVSADVVTWVATTVAEVASARSPAWAICGKPAKAAITLRPQRT